MTILIDGYNVLFAARTVPRAAAGALQQARQELLDFLVQRLTTAELTRTTIVFDAKQAPSGRDTECQYDVHGIRVLFARDHDEADDLLEQLIRRDISPETLLVVSTDRRIQRAAQRRRARTIDSDTWLGQLEQQRPSRNPAPPAAESPPEATPRDKGLSAEQARQWLDEFGIPHGDGEDRRE